MKAISFLFAIVLFATSCFSQNQRTFNVEGVERTAVIHEGEAKTKKSPGVFVFHGPGGNVRNAQRRLNFHDNWKEAMVVYMQGIPGVAGITDATGEKTGWQKNPGDVNDRDLKFFDELERFDPTSGEWTKFSTKTGLSGNAIYRVLKGKDGKKWGSLKRSCRRRSTDVARRCSAGR